MIAIKQINRNFCLVVQWVRLLTLDARSLGLIPGQGTRFTCRSKRSCAAAKTSTASVCVYTNKHMLRVCIKMSKGSLGSLMNFKGGKESSKLLLQCDTSNRKTFSLSLFLSLPLFKSSLIHRKWKGLIFDHGTICKSSKGYFEK